MTIGSFVTGFVGDKYGRRFTYQVNLLVFGLASIAAAFAQDMVGASNLEGLALPPNGCDPRITSKRLSAEIQGLFWHLAERPRTIVSE